MATTPLGFAYPASSDTPTGAAQIQALAEDIDDYLTAASPTGAGGDQVFYENDQTVTTSYTLTTGKNAMTAGPVTVNGGVTVTVPSGAAWVVV